MTIKQKLKRALGQERYLTFVRWIRDNFYGWHSRYYAEYGEDSIVNCLLHYKRDGFYVDVGAFHPKRLSSTYYFYKKQKWNGIVVEPNPRNCELFRSCRKRDIVVNRGAASISDRLNYYMFHDASQNTFSSDFKDDRLKEGMIVKDEKVIQVEPLAKIIEENLPPGRQIDYLNVDVEGLDLDVLKSNDWEKYRPSVITVEDIHFQVEEPLNSDIYNFLKSKKYSLTSVSHITLIFKANEFN